MSDAAPATFRDALGAAVFFAVLGFACPDAAFLTPILLEGFLLAAVLAFLAADFFFERGFLEVIGSTL
ncbi:MAG: hypothetical protein FJX48_14050 [Alphaproteobacteria bacterium]|nr:hypothetical protein [Alphaproteobacteria bacterium]